MPRLSDAERSALALALRRLDFLEPANELARQGLREDDALLGAVVQYAQAYPEREG